MVISAEVHAMPTPEYYAAKVHHRASTSCGASKPELHNHPENIYFLLTTKQMSTQLLSNRMLQMSNKFGPN